MRNPSDEEALSSDQPPSARMMSSVRHEFDVPMLGVSSITITAVADHVVSVVLTGVGGGPVVWQGMFPVFNETAPEARLRKVLAGYDEIERKILDALGHDCGHDDYDDE